MTQPPYGHGPVPPGGQPVPPRPGYGAPYGPPPGYRPPPPGYGQQPGPGRQPGYGQQPHPGQQPGYGQQPRHGQPGYGQPSAYGSPQGFPVQSYGPPGNRPPMPPPMPYGQPGHRPPPRRKRGGGGWLALALVLVFLVVAGLARTATWTGKDDASGPDSSFTFDPDTGAPSETATNPLLTDPNVTLIPASCDYAPWGTQVDAARRFFESAAGCLESAWKPILAKKNLPFQSPSLNISASTSGISTPCTGNTTDFAAFYCPANKTIYMPISQLQTELFKNNWVVYLSVFAHEYGHHIQAMSGILRKANSERVDAGVRSTKGLELSRRVELQANCFDGMYLGSAHSGGSLTTAQITVARRDARGRGDTRGDSRDHGTAENGGAWFEIGVDENRAAQCNTFTASADEVA